MNISKKQLLSFVFLTLFAFLAASSALPVRADDSLVGSQVGLEDIGRTTFGDATPTDIRLTMARVINVVLGFIGIVFLVLTVMGGFQYMTSAGNEEKTSEALAMIRSAVIGLVIVMAAWALTRYSIVVLNKTVQNVPGYTDYFPTGQ